MGARIVVVLVLGWSTACATEISGEGKPAQEQSVEAEKSAPPQKQAQIAVPMKSLPSSAAVPSEAPPPALTPEEEALIAADPNTLPPEQRTKRAYALRKKIMQNPDSPGAKQLKAMQESIERGESQLPPHLTERTLSAKVAPSQGAPAGADQAASDQR